MRSALFIIAIGGFILVLAKVTASSQILGLSPLQWWGIAGIGLMLCCSVYLGLEAREILDQPEDRDDGRV